MGLWLWAVVGGLAGTVLMDLTAIAAEKLNITSGGRCGGPQVIGRWVFGIFDARFVHKNIIDSSPVNNEASTGWIFHYLTGGSLALTYPLFYLALSRPMPQDHLISSVVWGLATTFMITRPRPSGVFPLVRAGENCPQILPECPRGKRASLE